MLGWPGGLPPEHCNGLFPSPGNGGTPERPPPAHFAGGRQMLIVFKTSCCCSPQRLWMRAHTGACECAGRQQAQSRAHRRTVGHSMCTMRSNSARSAQCAWYRARAQGGELQTAAHRCVRATLRRLTGGVLSPFAIWRGQAAGVSQHQATPAHSAAAQGQPPPRRAVVGRERGWRRTLWRCGGEPRVVVGELKGSWTAQPTPWGRSQRRREALHMSSRVVGAQHIAPTPLAARGAAGRRPEA